MTRIGKLKALIALAMAASGIAFAAPASAQATRTWVSGVGDDANPCSRTAPCKTFAGAISKTATGGEINCLDPGGFGGVTITKSLSIICDYTEGGVLTAGAGVNGITINIPATSTVFLSGLDFNGAGTAQNGVRIISGGIVHVRNSIIRNFRAANGLGMSVAPSGALQLTVTNTAIVDNGVAGAPGTGGGILIQPTGAGGSARVMLRDVRIQNNANNQLRIDTAGNTGPGITLFVENSQFFGGTNGIQIGQALGTATVTSMINDSYIALCTGIGIDINGGSGTRVRIGNSTITGCGTGVDQAGGIINTYGNNRLDGNTTLGTLTLPPIAEQ